MHVIYMKVSTLYATVVVRSHLKYLHVKHFFYSTLNKKHLKMAIIGLSLFRLTCCH